MPLITTDSLKQVFTDKQIDVMTKDLELDPFITINEGAIRTGKTFVFDPMWLRHIKKFNKKRFLMSASTKSALKDNVLDDLSNLYGIDAHISQEGQFQLWGNTIVCAGSDKADSFRRIKGTTYHGWFGNEITEHHKSFVDMAISRCSGHGAKIFWDTNPEQPEHYIKKQFIDRSGEKFSTGRTRILSHHFVLDDNNHLTPEYRETLKESYPLNSVWYKRNIEGLWVNAGNVIYTHYTKEKLSPQGAPGQYDYLGAGIDFGRGGQSPFAFVLCGVRGNEIHVLWEHKQQGGLNSEFIESVHEELLNLGYTEDIIRDIVMYGDRADPDKIMEWDRAGFFIKDADKSPGSVVRGIEEVMRHPLVINTDCVHTLMEIESYEWRTTRAGEILEEPVKHNDHFMDALRYFAYTHFTGNNTQSLIDLVGAYEL